MLTVSENSIASKIYLIRGNKVMLDRDLAELYGVENKRLGEQVKRNNNKFPSDFMFQITEGELKSLQSQFATANISTKSRVLLTVFTEHGVLMLANVLNSERADNVSIQLIRIFTKMREMIVSQKDILLKIEQLERKGISHDQSLKQVFQVLNKLIVQKSTSNEPIGFKTKDNR